MVARVALSTGGDDDVADDGLVKAAADLAPKLLARADEAERLRRLPDETIDDLEAAGLLKLTTPRTYGGLQTPITTILRVMEELGRGCASTSFVTCAYVSTAWMVCLISDEAQKEVFSSENPKAIGAINPGGTATPEGDGFVLSGRWPFSSGQHHAGWAMNMALIDSQDGAFPDVGLFLVPRSEFQSADDWDVTGMAATGSATLSVEKTFVPAHRAVRLQDFMTRQGGSELVRTDPYYQGPFLPYLSAMFAGTPLGMAEAALDGFAERIGRRAITYTTYLRQADAAITHFQMAEARMKVDEARFHAYRLATVAQEVGADIDLLTSARCRADISWDLRLCREAVDIVESASGAQAIHRKDPLQRVIRDIHAMSVHALLLSTTNAELYGRVLCGLDPGVPFM